MPTKVDEKLCVGCGECYDVCPVSPGVYKMVLKSNKKKSTVVNPNSCIECGACIMACPESAIKRQE